MLEMRHVTKIFNPGTVDEKIALNDLSFTLNDGDFVTVIGGNGAGKSTMQNAICGTWLPDAGEILLDGIDLSSLSEHQRAKYLGRVYQDPMTGTAAGMQIEENLALAARRGLRRTLRPGIRKAEREEYRQRLQELGLGLDTRLSAKVGTLSGGQRQRVALARSLAKRPKLLLLDEPMGALDKKLRDRMQLEVVDILERVGVTCVMVTHDQEEAMTMAGRIAIMNRGKFVQIGEPEEIYEHPTTRYSAEFIGSVNVFEGLVKERLEDGLVLSSPGLMHPLKVDPDASVVDNVPVWVALRPEKIMLCDEPPADGYNFAVGEVIHIAYLGDLSIYHVRLQSGQMISAQLQNEHRHRKGTPTWGDEVRLCWDADSCVVLTV